MSTSTEPRKSRLWIFVLVMTIIGTALGAFAVLYVTSQRDHAVNKAQTQTKKAVTATKDKHEAEATTQVVKDSGRDLADQVLAACAGTGKEAKALRAAALCGQATETKTAITKAAPGAPGRTGARGPGPTFVQVLEAVRQLIDSAVLNACGGSCVGSDGKASTVPGPQGTAGKDAAPAQDGKEGPQGPVGPAGPAGPQGDAGKPGRGIVSGPQCDDDGNLVTTYDQEPFTESHPAPGCVAPLLPVTPQP